jgi:guanylate kinase
VHGNYYGTSKAFVEAQAKLNKVTLFDVDVQGVDSLKKAFGKKALSVFVLPPSLEELELRLRARSTESEEKILARLAAAKQELLRAPDFDHQIVNHKLEDSFAELCRIMEAEVGLC